jgi:hypothetical protein
MAKSDTGEGSPEREPSNQRLRLSTRRPFEACLLLTQKPKDRGGTALRLISRWARDTFDEPAPYDPRVKLFKEMVRIESHGVRPGRRSSPPVRREGGAIDAEAEDASEE